MKKQHDIRIDRTKLHPWLDYKLGILLEKCGKKVEVMFVKGKYAKVRYRGNVGYMKSVYLK